MSLPHPATSVSAKFSPATLFSWGTIGELLCGAQCLNSRFSNQILGKKFEVLHNLLLVE
jgi:hypothetical protein